MVQGMVTLWEKRVKESEGGGREWAELRGNVMLLGHALLVSVKLLCVLQAAGSPDQRQAGILALDIAHRLNTAQTQRSVHQTTREDAVFAALPLIHLSAELLAGSSAPGSAADNESLLRQLRALLPDTASCTAPIEAPTNTGS
jgi:hypothetical protein